MVISAKNFFQVGESALSNFSSLEKVVLLKQVPRYDPVDVDPLSIKPVLVQLYHNTITEQWMNSKFKEDMIIGSHNIDCTGAINEARYRETKSGKSGQKAYTNSVLASLRTLYSNW